VFYNIRGSHLRIVVAKILIIPCSQAIKWVINHTDTKNKTNIKDEGRSISSCQPFELEKYYRLDQLEKCMIIGFVEKFHQENDIKKILERWWVENNRFFAKSDGVYRMTNLRDPYIYAVDLMCILYGEAIFIHFKYAWVSIEHVVTTTSEIFNWAAILSHTFKRSVEKVKKLTTKFISTFYMDSYMLDIIFSSNLFPDLNWSWNIVSSPIHVY